MRKIIFTSLSIIIGLFLGVFLLKFFYLNIGSHEEAILNSRKEDTKYENIQVYTREEYQNEKRSLLHLSYPVTENKSINLILENKAQLFIDEFKDIAKKQEQAYQDYIRDTGKQAASFGTEYVQHFDISFANDKYLLFIFDQYRSTGGTGDERSFSLLFDRQSGQEIPISSIFSDDNYLEILSLKSQKILTDRVRGEAADMVFKTSDERLDWTDMCIKQIIIGTEPLSKNFDSIVISENNDLVIIFDKYQVAAGVDGMVRIEIPLEEIFDILSLELRETFDIKNDNFKDVNLENKSTKKKYRRAVDCSLEKCVALTFDDGPSIHTEGLLDLLKENNVLATFFVLGRSAKIQPDTIRRIIADGHVIGNHTWDHKNLTTLSPEAVQKQISDTDNLIKEIADYEINLLRPPYGAYNKSLQKIINKAIVLWSIDPEDWKDKDVKIVTERMSKAEAGSIILAHDIYPSTIEAIPLVIENLKNKGLHFVTINELLPPEKIKEGLVLRFQGI